MKRIVAILLLCATLCAIFTGCRREKPTQNGALAGNYDVTIWVSEINGVAELFREEIGRFEKNNPGIKINAKIEGVSEAKAGSQVLTDVKSAPDMYCFAQDQLARLVRAGALASPSDTVAARLGEANDKTSIEAASVGGKMHAYPMTSDNGYFMYYDKSIISDEDADSLERIIEICEEKGKKIRFALEDGWYTASFFFATGCDISFNMDENGSFISVEDSFNSPAGLIAMKGMRKLTQSRAYDSDADTFADAAAVITGIWKAEAARAHFGDNLGATDLPSFTVDGKSYHLGSFTGNKLLGVKPQSDSKRTVVLSMLAEYLTSAECQRDRLVRFGWGPSNLTVRESDEVKNDPSLAALAKQSENGVPQGQIHGSWWDVVKILGADARVAKSDADLEAALKRYGAAVSALIGK